MSDKKEQAAIWSELLKKSKEELEALKKVSEQAYGQIASNSDESLFSKYSDEFLKPKNIDLGYEDLWKQQKHNLHSPVEKSFDYFKQWYPKEQATNLSKQASKTVKGFPELNSPEKILEYVRSKSGFLEDSIAKTTAEMEGAALKAAARNQMMQKALGAGAAGLRYAGPAMSAWDFLFNSPPMQTDEQEMTEREKQRFTQEADKLDALKSLLKGDGE